MTISVNNSTLDAEKTLFTIGIEAGREMQYIAPPASSSTGTAYIHHTTSVPTLEQDEDGAVLKYKGCTTHIVRVLKLSSDVISLANKTGFRQYYSTMNQSLKLDLYLGWHFGLSSDYVLFYNSLAQILHNARVINASFRLDALDIEQLDMFTPVYLRQYGAYFYINKISNFGAGPTTEVELIKM